MPKKPHPSYIVIVAHTGQPGIRIASAHATAAEAAGMIDMLSSLVSPGSAVYLMSLPETVGILGNVIEPVNAPVAAEKAPAPLPVTPQEPEASAPAPAEKPAPFRRLSQDAFIIETQNMMENGAIQWRDADAPLGEGGAIG